MAHNPGDSSRGSAVATSRGHRRTPLVASCSAVALAILLLATCSSSASASTGSGGPYKVPMYGDMTGALGSSIGVPGVAGIKAAIKSAGKVNGHAIVLGPPVDTMTSATAAAGAAAQVLSGNPLVVMGASGSNTLTAMVPTFTQAQVPVISTTTIDSLLVPKPTPWFFTTTSDSSQQAALAVDGLKSLLGGSLKGKKIAFEGLSAASVDTTLAAVQAAITKAGAKLVDTERATGSITSFASGAANIVAAKPNGVITVDSTPNTVIVAKALDVAGYNGPVLASVGANDDATLQAVNWANFYVPRTYNSVQDSKVMTAAAIKARVTGDTNSAYFAQGYTMGLVLVAGLKKCGYPCSAAKLPKAIEKIGTLPIGDVGFGPLQFNAKDHNGVTAGQFFAWDGSTQKAVPKGGVIKI
jgi:branched-chain amino acid transport system substrate-binding protein